MAKHGKKRAKKFGMPPGTLLHPEEPLPEASKITIIDYDEKYFHAEQTHTVETCIPFKTSPTVTWINVDTIHDVKLLERMGAVFAMHPLTMEDIQSVDQRPKMDDYDEYIYLDLKILSHPETGEINAEAISIVIGPSYVITFHEKESAALNPIRDRIRSAGGRIRKMSADYLGYCLMDTIVDNYFLVLERFDERIELLQAELLENPTTKTLSDLNKLKREIIFLRKSVWPLREVIVKLERSDSPLIKEATKLYLRDVYDHTIYIVDAIESFRDILGGMLDIYLSANSNRLNEVIKFLTIISTIFIPLTFLAGVYGMNFKHFPELDLTYGYPLFWVVNLGIAVGLLFYFKRKGWL
ncbi:MAG: magnesium/cobalt transporter CorA [Nitrospinae bacterium]|nr:magnesium/cobalt transporter CorA [Nitrospinota bacterium]